MVVDGAHPSPPQAPTPTLDRELARVRERLRATYPSAPASTIDAALQESIDHFAASPVQSFIPVLVERRAHDHLGRI